MSKSNESFWAFKTPRAETTTLCRRVNFRRTALGLAFLLMGVWSCRAQDLSDVSRSNSWTTVHVTNTHGTVRNPTSAVWSYWWQPGRYDDGAGYALTSIRPALWQPMNALSTYKRLQWINPATGSAAGGGGTVEGRQTYLRAYWNTDPSPAMEWKPSWALAVYTEQDAFNVYDMGGKLEWTGTQTASGWNRQINIGVVRAGGGAYEPLLTRSLTSSETGGTLFDEGAEGQPVPAELRRIGLRQGDQLVIGVRGSTDQYRGINLFDRALTLRIVTPQGANLAKNLSRSFCFTNNTLHVSNHHGSAAEPSADIWSYWWQPGQIDEGEGYALVSIRLALWAPMKRTAAASYNLVWTDAGGGERPGGASVRAVSGSLRSNWDSAPTPDMEWQPSWALAVYTERAGTRTYAVGGKLEWVAQNTADGTRVASIVIVRAENGSIETLYQANLTTSELDVPQTLFDENAPEGTPVPSALRQFTLQENDRLVIGLRGSSNRYRAVRLLDEFLTLQIHVPQATLIAIR